MRISTSLFLLKTKVVKYFGFTTLKNQKKQSLTLFAGSTGKCRISR